MRNYRIGIFVAAAALALVLAHFALRESTQPTHDGASRAEAERSSEVGSALDRIEAPILRSVDVAHETAAADPPAAASSAHAGKIRLVGEVRDRKHKPIRAPRGDISLGATVSIETGSRGTVRGTPDGTFAFDDLSPGRIEVACAARDFRTQRRTITLVAGEIEHREDFELDPVWKLDVRVVLSDGRDLAPKEARKALFKNDLLLRVSKDPPPERWSCTWPEIQRLQELVERTAGDEEKGFFAQLRLQLDPPIHLSADLAGYVVASARIESPVDRVTLEIPVERFNSNRSSFACRVVDRETGAPLPSARARLLPVGPGVDPTLKADAAGEIRGDDLPVGEFLLSVSDPSHSGPWESVELLPGKLTDLGTLALDANVSLDIRFVDQAGRPLEVGAGLFPSSHRNVETTKWLGARHVAAGSDGRCHFEKLARSEYVLRRVGNSVLVDDVWLEVPPQVVDLRRGAIPELVVTLEPMQRVCLEPKAESVKSFAYWIFASDGALCDMGLLGLGVVLRRPSLVPGAYRLLFGPDLEHAREIPFTLGNAPMTIPIEP